MDKDELMRLKSTHEQLQWDYVSNVTNQDISHEIVPNDGPKTVRPIGLKPLKSQNGSP